MTRTSSRNDRTPPKIEIPQKQNTRKSTLHTVTTTTSQKDRKNFGRSKYFPSTQRVKSGNNKEARKPVVPVVKKRNYNTHRVKPIGQITTS